MDQATHIQTKTQLVAFANVVLDMQLSELVQELNHIETISPITQPTEYTKAAINIDQIKSLAEALLEFQEMARKIQKKQNDVV